MNQELQLFLERVLPDDGVYFVGTLYNKKYIQTPLKSIDALGTAIEEIARNQRDVYFATGTFKSASRIAANTHLKKCFYMDLDCGDKKPFTDVATALTALFSFCATISLPKPNMVVSSGYGLHVYWCLKSPIGLEIWQPIATALKQLTETHEFEADKCTADAARILRPPTTRNYKRPNKPYNVFVLQQQQTGHIFETFEVSDIALPVLGQAHGLTPAVPPAVVTTILPPVEVSDLSGGLSADKEYFTAPMIRKCLLLRHVTLTHGANSDEPEWKGILNLLAFAKDGAKYIHVIGSAHKGYSERNTIIKFNQRQVARDAKRTGPTLCSTFNSAMCKGCTYAGNIKTPLVLGEPDIPKVLEDGAKLPYGYMQNDTGMFRKIDGEMVKILSYQILDFQAYYDSEVKGSVLSFTWKLDKASGPAEIPMDKLTDRRSMASTLSMYSMALHKQQSEEFAQLMVSWFQQMQRAKNIKQLTSKMGWTTRGKAVGFVVGDRITWDNGDLEQAIMSEKVLKNWYSVVGKYGPWHAAADFIIKQNYADAQAVLATTFAAPLIKFSGVVGVVLSVVSKKSGTGKSTLLKTAQAAWGCPRRGINAINDTSNSVSKRMGNINNLPVYWDELQYNGNEQQIKAFVQMIFQLAQGKEKSRLKADTSYQEMGTWETLLAVASNQSLLDHVDHNNNSGSDAGRLRVFEIELKDHITGRDISQANPMFLPLETNYGHAGAMYSKYLVTHYEEVKGLMNDTTASLTKSLKATADERFWIAILTSMIVGMTLANRANIVTFDVPKVTKFLVYEFLRMRGSNVAEYHSEESTGLSQVFRYLKEHEDYAAVVECMATKNKAQGAILRVPERTPAYVVISQEDNNVRIDYRHFRAWLYKTGASVSWVINDVRKSGGIERRGTMIKGLPGSINSRLSVLDIPLDAAAIKSMIGELEEGD